MRIKLLEISFCGKEKKMKDNFQFWVFAGAFWIVALKLVAFSLAYMTVLRNHSQSPNDYPSHSTK